MWLLRLFALLVLTQIAFYTAFALGCARFYQMRGEAPPGCLQVSERMQSAYEMALAIVLSLLGGSGLKGEPLLPAEPPPPG